MDAVQLDKFDSSVVNRTLKEAAAELDEVVLNELREKWERRLKTRSKKYEEATLLALLAEDPGPTKSSMSLGKAAAKPASKAPALKRRRVEGQVDGADGDPLSDGDTRDPRTRRSRATPSPFREFRSLEETGGGGLDEKDFVACDYEDVELTEADDDAELLIAPHLGPLSTEENFGCLDWVVVTAQVAAGPQAAHTAHTARAARGRRFTGFGLWQVDLKYLMLHGRYRALTGKAKALQRELGAATLHFDFTGDDGPDPGPGRASSTSQPAEEVSFRADKLCTCSQPCSHV
eukprot:EG_transcript_17329